jgi:hypothetical protein
MKFVETFPHSYVLDVSPDWPMSGEKVLTFPAHSIEGTHTGVFHDIRFYPQGSESWIGRFEWAQRGKFEHLVTSMPNPEHACVISCGTGYWVDVQTGNVTNLELALPVTSALTSTNHHLLFLATWSDLYAWPYGSRAFAWSLQDIALDELRLVSIDGDFLTATGFVDGEDVEMKIDLTLRKVIRKRPSKKLTVDFT